MKLSTDDKKKLIKWSSIGGSVLLVGLATLLNMAFSGEHSLFDFGSSSSQSDDKPSFDVVIGEDVPYLDIDPTLPSLSESEEENLKETLWRHYQGGEIQEAAELILKEFKENQFSESSELYDWYVDLSLLNVLDQMPVENRPEALKNIQIPRLIAMNLAQETLLLHVAEVIQDPVSLVPYAGENVLFVSETYIEDLSTWEAPSDHAEVLKDSLRSVWEIQLTFEGEPLMAVVGKMKVTNKNAIIGFYGESQTLLTDEYVESKRQELEQIPIFQ